MRSCRNIQREYFVFPIFSTKHGQFLGTAVPTESFGQTRRLFSAHFLRTLRLFFSRRRFIVEIKKIRTNLTLLSAPISKSRKFRVKRETTPPLHFKSKPYRQRVETGFDIVRLFLFLPHSFIEPIYLAGLPTRGKARLTFRGRTGTGGDEKDRRLHSR